MEWNCTQKVSAYALLAILKSEFCSAHNTLYFLDFMEPSEFSPLSSSLSPFTLPQVEDINMVMSGSAQQGGCE